MTLSNRTLSPSWWEAHLEHLDLLRFPCCWLWSFPLISFHFLSCPFISFNFCSFHVNSFLFNCEHDSCILKYTGGLLTLGEAILRTPFRAIVSLPYFTLPHIRNLNNSSLQTPLMYFKVHWGGSPPLEKRYLELKKIILEQFVLSIGFSYTFLEKFFSKICSKYQSGTIYDLSISSSDYTYHSHIYPGISLQNISKFGSKVCCSFFCQLCKLGKLRFRGSETILQGPTWNGTSQMAPLTCMTQRPG